jgi:hypothetical protein
MTSRVLLAAAIVAVFVSPATAVPTIRAFALPTGFTVAPESETRDITIAPGGDIVAVAEETDATRRSRAFRWDTGGVRTTFSPLNVATQPDPEYRGNETIAMAVAGPNDAYVTAGVNWSGAYSGYSTEAQRWTAGGAAARWSEPACVSSSSERDQQIRAVDGNGNLALTKVITGTGSFLVMTDSSDDWAPYAFIVNGRSCRVLGRAVVTNVRGMWATGYRGYLDGHVAPTNLNRIRQRNVAVRWHGSHATELGEGDALAVTSAGFVVGASAIPGRFDSDSGGYTGTDGVVHTFTDSSPAPHALAWTLHGTRIALARTAPRSVAYDVADDGTVVGMLVARDGKHYAFRWRHGRLERLDDLPHPPGWRFESAYAIAPDGTIAGIGTFDGVATVFTWHA